MPQSTDDSTPYMKKHYIYKITFAETPHVYYGIRSHEDPYTDSYTGSPVTHRSYWKMYTPIKTILWIYLTRKEAEKVELELIRQNWQHKYCLNEHYGGNFSEEASSRGGKIGGKNNSSENKARAGRIGGKNQPQEAKVRGGKNGDRNGKSRGGKVGGKVTSLQRWQCTVTGYISTPGPLSLYQKARNIDISNRVCLFDDSSLLTL